MHDVFYIGMVFLYIVHGIFYVDIIYMMAKNLSINFLVSVFVNLIVIFSSL